MFTNASPKAHVVSVHLRRVCVCVFKPSRNAPQLNVKICFCHPRCSKSSNLHKWRQAQQWLHNNKRSAHTDASHMYTRIKHVNICCLPEYFTLFALYTWHASICSYSPIFTLVLFPLIFDSRPGGSLILCQQTFGVNGRTQTQTGITWAWAATLKVNSEQVEIHTKWK